MANIKAKGKRKKLSEEAIDQVVVAQAEDDSAWGKPVHVRKTKPVSVRLSAQLAARAAFFARLHREASVEAWLRRIIQERIDLEDAAFAGLKRDLAVKGSRSQYRNGKSV
jgi:hypothetical protein